jgi:hypothetical protein
VIASARAAIAKLIFLSRVMAASPILAANFSNYGTENDNVDVVVSLLGRWTPIPFSP